MTYDEHVLHAIADGAHTITKIQKRLPQFMRADIRGSIHRAMFSGLVVRRIGYGYSVRKNENRRVA